MNAENLNRVADAIEKHEIAWLGFNMNLWFDPKANPLDDLSGKGCGTTACVAGWAAAVSMKRPTPRNLNQDFIRLQATDFLELNNDEAYTLFFRRAHPYVTPAEAVRTLRYAAKHGVIDWDAAQKEVRP